MSLRAFALGSIVAVVVLPAIEAQAVSLAPPPSPYCSWPALTVNRSGLTPGHVYFTIVSAQPAPGGPGTGPYLGLWASDPSTLLAQVSLPLGSGPFHFVAQNSTASFGPFAILPEWSMLPIEVVVFDFTGGVIGPVSPVVAVTLPYVNWGQHGVGCQG